MTFIQNIHNVADICIIKYGVGVNWLIQIIFGKSIVSGQPNKTWYLCTKGAWYKQGDLDINSLTIFTETVLYKHSGSDVINGTNVYFSKTRMCMAMFNLLLGYWLTHTSSLSYITCLTYSLDIDLHILPVWVTLHVSNNIKTHEHSKFSIKAII